MRRAAAFLGGLVLAFGMLQPLAGQEEGITPGTPAPAVVVKDLDGRSVDLGAVIGSRPVLIEFWATWCTSCQAMMPALTRMQEKFGDAVEFYGVNITISETREGVREYVAEHQPPFLTLYDEEGVAARAYEPPATSFIVIADSGGTVVYTGSGGQQDLEPVLRKVTGRQAPAE